MQTKDLTLHTLATAVNSISSNICTLNLTAFHRDHSTMMPSSPALVTAKPSPQAGFPTPPSSCAPGRLLYLGQGLLPKKDHATYCVKLPVTLGIEAKPTAALWCMPMTLSP